MRAVIEGGCPRRATLCLRVTDDAELYRRWRGGDDEAATQLVERHYASVARFFRTKVGPEHADDLVQRTFLGCIEGDFRGEGLFRAYLFGIARMLLLGFFKGRHRDAKVDPDFTVSSVLELAPGLSTVAAGRADQRLLVVALQRIPLEIQMTLELFYWEDLSVAELSEALGIPPGTVKSRLHRGRQLVKEAMDGLVTTPDTRSSVRALLDDWAQQMRRRVPG